MWWCGPQSASDRLEGQLPGVGVPPGCPRRRGQCSRPCRAEHAWPPPRTGVPRTARCSTPAPTARSRPARSAHPLRRSSFDQGGDRSRHDVGTSEGHEETVRSGGEDVPGPVIAVHAEDRPPSGHRLYRHIPERLAQVRQYEDRGLGELCGHRKGQAIRWTWVWSPFCRPPNSGMQFGVTWIRSRTTGTRPPSFLLRG